MVHAVWTFLTCAILFAGTAFCGPARAEPGARRAISSTGARLNTVYPRVITPNDDGLNDRVFFVTDTPVGQQSVEGVVYDIHGARVGEFATAHGFAAPGYAWFWNGNDSSGRPVTAGIYIYRFRIGEATFTGSVVVAR